MSYFKRPLTNAILESAQKVVIVEGARAVGKTRMAREEIAPLGFSYYSLADKMTYDTAKGNPDFWIESINHPAIIDEAQRIEGLTLSIKEFVDRQDEPGIHFILTGSASIGKAGLDGQDPLTRRHQRFTLYPLTQREIIGNDANLVDDLWNGTLNMQFEDDLTDTQLTTQLTVGGFPHYVNESILGHLGNIGNQIRADLRSVLGDTLLPDERLDQTIANAILNRLLTLPGDVLNMSSIGRTLDCDNRTVERYVSIFNNRFLIRYLPNLKSLPQKQSFTRAKIHPVDVSFSIEALKGSGCDPIAERAMFGKILESYVVSQIVPDAQWATIPSDCYYWREAGKSPKEVDLVLMRNNELVGIEVKAARNFSLDDFDGLRVLAKDPRFHRGYLVYRGNKVMKVSEKLCAIPLSALWDSAAFAMPKPHTRKCKETQSTKTPLEETMPMDANLFLSYCHADNDHLDNAMVALANELAQEYEFQFGTRLQVFVDKKDLRWGDDWQAEIDRNIEETHFLIPCVTPRYLRSQACRDEFLQFLGRTTRNKRCKILSLIWQAPASNQPDQVMDAIGSFQYEDVSSLRNKTAKDNEYKETIQRLAKSLHEVIAANNSLFEQDEHTKTHDDEDVDYDEADEGIFEKIDRVAEEIPVFNKALDGLKDNFSEISEVVNDMPFPANAAGGYTKWGIAIAQKTKPALNQLNDNLDKTNSIWNGCYDLMADCIRLGSETNQDISGILPMLYSLQSSLSSDFDIEEAENVTKTLPMLSSRLRPLSKGLRRLLDTFRDIREMTESLIREAESASAQS